MHRELPPFDGIPKYSLTNVSKISIVQEQSANTRRKFLPNKYISVCVRVWIIYVEKKKKMKNNAVIFSLIAKPIKKTKPNLT